MQTQLDTGDRPGDFAGDEGFAPQRRFMIKEYSVAGEKVVCLPIIDRDLISVDFGRRIRTSRIKRRLFGLGSLLDLAVQFTG